MKKVLWVTNVLLPEASKLINQKALPLGGWLTNSALHLATEEVVHLFIAAPYHGKKLLYQQGEKITYIYFPAITKYHSVRHEKMFNAVLTNINPSLVHLFGSELAHSYLFAKVAKKLHIPLALNLQGIVSEIAKVHNASLPRSATLIPTLRSLIRRDGINRTRRQFVKRGYYERLLLHDVNYIIGRTKWDHAFISAHHFPGHYFVWNETLRSPFYKTSWSSDKMTPHTLFISQANYPLKGLHIALHALALVKKDYPDVHLRIAGTNIINQRIMKIKAISQYGNYIKRLLKKLKLTTNVTFLGLINEAQMVNELVKTHVFILPSFIENSPNSLGEALTLGTPSIASRVGGTPEYITQGVSGFLYDVLDVRHLASLINHVFCLPSDALALLSTNAKQEAKQKFNEADNHATLLAIYQQILGGF